MKEINTQIKIGFFKKIFIKICRILGYEIIDQSNFYVPTQKKSLSENSLANFREIRKSSKQQIQCFWMKITKPTGFFANGSPLEVPLVVLSSVFVRNIVSTQHPTELYRTQLTGSREAETWVAFFSDRAKIRSTSNSCNFQTTEWFQSYWALGYLPRTETHDNGIDNPNF